MVGWRFLVDGVGEISAWTVRLARGKVFLTIPLGGGRIYCYADAHAPAPTDPTSGDPARLAELCGEFAEPIPTIIRKHLATGDPPYFSPIEEVVHQPWARGRVVLVGDAAHAMSPNMAEGAGMALEDALVLAETIAADRPLAQFEARRRPRVEFVQTQTHRRDRMRNLPPVLRNVTVRLAGSGSFAQLQVAAQRAVEHARAQATPTSGTRPHLLLPTTSHLATRKTTIYGWRCATNVEGGSM